MLAPLDDRHTILRAVLALTVVLFAGTGLSGCASDDGATDDEVEIFSASEADAKADLPSIRFEPLTSFSLSDDRAAKEHGRVFRSAKSFERYFNFDAPAEIDFDRQWIALYAAGAQPTAGYEVAIERIQMTKSSGALRVFSRVLAPHVDCQVDAVESYPYAMVVFDAPAAKPRQSRFGVLDGDAECETRGARGWLCGEDLGRSLGEATDGLVYKNGDESAPFEYVEFMSAGAAAGDLAKVRSALELADDQKLAQMSTADFLAPLIAEDPAFEALEQAVRLNLFDAEVFVVGESPVDIYIIGRSACDDLAGLKTRGLGH